MYVCIVLTGNSFYEKAGPTEVVVEAVSENLEIRVVLTITSSPTLPALASHRHVIDISPRNKVNHNSICSIFNSRADGSLSMYYRCCQRYVIVLVF